MTKPVASRLTPLLAGTLVLAGTSAAHAAPSLRVQMDLEGDFVLFGNGWANVSRKSNHK